MKIDEKQSGTFTVSPGNEIYGELTVAGLNSTLYLRHKDFFQPNGMPGSFMTGVLHDMTRVSLIDCVAAPLPSTVSRGVEHYYYANVFPNFVVSGDQHLSPDESSITGVEFSIDDAATLFRDFGAFGWIPDANDLIEMVVAKEPPMRQRRIGAGAQLIYFTGRRQIFSSETVYGTISASHNPIPRLQVPAEAGFKNNIAIEIAFAEGICFREAISRTARVIELMGLIVGRPQNLRGLHLRTTVEHAPRGLAVHPSMFPERDSFKEFKRPDSFDILLDAVDRPEHFAEVVKNWFSELPQRHNARWRFFNSFARQKSYDIDRLVGTANMFDILPDSAVPPDSPLSDELRTAQAQARQLFRHLPRSPERASILGALGRLGKSSLKHKIRHRARVLLESCGDRFRDLSLVTDEAANCRNYYVHGSTQAFDYDRHFDAVLFFTDTLEFVFATSDLIEAGWDMKAWIARGTTESHPFGSYCASYTHRLLALKALLPVKSAN